MKIRLYSATHLGALALGLSVNAAVAADEPLMCVRINPQCTSANPTGTSPGKGGTDSWTADAMIGVGGVTGSGAVTVTPPDDGINRAANSYKLPEVSRMVEGRSCQYKEPSAGVKFLVTRKDLFKQQYLTIAPEVVVSSTAFSYSVANPISTSHASTVDTLVKTGDAWTVAVVENGTRRNSANQLVEWTQISALCKLPMR
jgi:hypothetical protein